MTDQSRKRVQRNRRSTACLPVLVLLLALGAGGAIAQPNPTQTPPGSAASPATSPLPGQIVSDPEHPQWLKRHGGRHIFICGPGDPEDFLYVGRRNPDGTRDGDQVRRIQKLIEHGGNCVYMQAVRSHGGDAKTDKTQNPFVDSDPAQGIDEDILNQWEEWFSLMDRNDILIYLFFYDDGAGIWDTGDRVGMDEQTFVETIVRKFKHHRNLIWVVGEESEERYTSARVQAIAAVIKNADEHGHLIGNHHLSGTMFKAWQPRGALNHFAMQLSETDDKAHAGAIEALQMAAGRYQVIYSESTAMRTDVDGMRRHAWSVAMAGMMPMLLRMDIASTPVESLKQCRTLQAFFEATDFYTMTSHDELKHAETKYVLADAGRSYIAYADKPASKLGIKGLPAGRYTVTWLDCRTGETASGEAKFDQPGDHTFDKPQRIGAESAAWIRRAVGKTGLVDEPLQGQTKGKHTPKADFIGTDQFIWKVNDGTADSKIVSVTLTVSAKKDDKPVDQTQIYFPTPDAEGGWRTLKTADEIRRIAGMDKQKLDEAFAFIQGSTKSGGLLVLRKGWLVYEDYFGLGHREATPNLASCGKSFTSIAVGILMADRPELFPDGLDQKIFTPTYFPPAAFPVSDPRKKDIKLGQLLTFSAGIRGNNPSYVMGRETTIDPVGPDGWQAKVEAFALGKRDGTYGKTPFSTATLWCKPGEGYSYASASIHLASIMLRHVTGLELQEYLDRHLGKPLGWGRWGYGYKNHPEVTHTPGGGGIVLRATDMLRFGYLLLREGRWNDEQLVPAEYIRRCARKSPYNPHYPYSLQFNVNTDGSVPELPRDAFWKGGSGGHCLYIVPSLDLVVWKLGGRDEQYSPANTGLPVSPASKEQVAARQGWKETVEKETALRKTLQMVIGAVEPQAQR